MAKEIKSKIDSLLKMPAEELRANLPLAIDETRQYGLSKAIEEMPDMLSKIIGRIIEIDSAKFLSESPETTEKFMDFIWEFVGTASEKFDELKPAFEKASNLKTGRLSVNFDSADSPFKCYFRIRNGKLEGGVGLLRFKDQDVRLLGYTSQLLKILTGDLDMGKLVLEWHPGLRYIVRPVMLGVATIVNGKRVETVPGEFALG